MITLPFQAFKLFFQRPRLFALGVFPGLFTFAGSAVAVYAGWTLFLYQYPLYLALPAMMLLFLVVWLLLGNLSLLPVEDSIVDECQRAVWGEVRLPSPRLGFRRLLREAGYSILLAVSAFLLVTLSVIPGLAVLNFVLAGWLTAYAFLAGTYARRIDSISGRLTVFFEHPFSNFLLGALLNFLLFVPVLNVFLLGYAQVLATLVYLHRENRALA